MKVVLFCHSLLSDWNHGNAHFLRGVVSELAARGHQVKAYEPRDAWSAQNLERDTGSLPIAELARRYPRLDTTRYGAELELERAIDGAELVMVHEWNSPELVSALGRLRLAGARPRLLFHDTHHRSVSDEGGISGLDLTGYDGVLAFGEAVRERYVRAGWARRAFTWHEAADTRVFRPLQRPRRGDLVWIGNFGDEERTRELDEFLLEPAFALGLRSKIYGVRYPDQALRAIAAAGAEFGGYLPNFAVPEAFAEYALTLHVPRRPYVDALPGIPTIRVFEALACGVPLISAPWNDCEGLFRRDDFVSVRDGAGMRQALRELLNDPQRARETAARGLETVLARHTCAHRVDELLAIARDLGVSGLGTEKAAIREAMTWD